MLCNCDVRFDTDIDTTMFTRVQSWIAHWQKITYYARYTVPIIAKIKHAAAASTHTNTHKTTKAVQGAVTSMTLGWRLGERLQTSMHPFVNQRVHPKRVP